MDTQSRVWTRGGEQPPSVLARLTAVRFHTGIGLVIQEPMIFARSVEGNIAYGELLCRCWLTLFVPGMKPSQYTFDDVQEAAKLAHAHEFISQLPNVGSCPRRSRC